MDDGTPNICAGPFGTLYNFYIERPQLMQAIGRTVWGIDASVLYDSMRPLSEIEDGKTVLDVPCGGGVAFRALPQGRNIRYVAIDIDEAMLARARVRAQGRGLEAEFVAGDMLKLPFDDGEADLVLSYSGLHMVSDPERAHMPDRQRPYAAMVARMSYLSPPPELWRDLLDGVIAFLDPILSDDNGQLSHWDPERLHWRLTTTCL
jgi:SAM-dependent methyltransferase